MTDEPTWKPGERFARALGFAVDVHASQPRKGSNVPYIGHLLGVCSIVIDDGGSEDEAIAALLHDAAEDAGGEATLEEIGAEFGPDVRRIVAACSDTFEEPKPPWRARKQKYIEGIPHKQPDELRVSLADKVHNATAILHDHRELGDELWARFKEGRDDQLWYYRELADAFQQKSQGRLADRLSETVRMLEAEAGG
ncbi:MAG: HD domain-containing protein [Gaiellaceae bacterium]